MTTDCINLKQTFGERYKVGYDESYRADHGENARREDPWLMVLFCQHGHICPWGGSKLAACTDRRGSITKAVMNLPFVDRSASQDADDGVNAVFEVEHFEAVARIMRPRRRRQMTPEQKRRLAEAGAMFRFSPGAQASETARECVSVDDPL